MNLELKALIECDSRYRSVLKTVVETPYVERQTLDRMVNLPHGDLESLLSVLVEKVVILELASQADSSVESRVPKKVYLVNPELERDIRDVV